MHYGYNAFAIDRSKPTIYSKIASVKTEDLGVTDQMRESDIKLIRNMYGCGKSSNYKELCRNNNFDDDCAEKCPWACTQDKITIRYMKENCVKACGWCY